MKSALLLQFVLFRQIVSELQQVLKFDPKFGSGNYDDDIVRFAVNNKSLANGYSVCMRANFQILNTNCLFKADHNIDLTLFGYQRGGGSISINTVETYFQPNSDALERLSTWQSYCVIFTSKPAIQVWF